MKYFLLLLLLATFFISCKKDNAPEPTIAKDLNSPDNATVISTGKIAFFDERYDEGIAKIYLRKDGVYVLGLEQMNYQTMFFDTDVWLSAALQLTTASIKIFSTKKLHGNNYYALPSGIDIPAFKYLIIQGDKDTNPVASATLE